MPLQNDQPESNDFFYQLDVCCRLVAEKFGQPETERWLNGNYIQLSSVLFRQTAIQISPSTLKRIFGKLKTTERYYPQKATRDALAQYAGFKDWDNFISKYPRPPKIEKMPELNQHVVEQPKITDPVPQAIAAKQQRPGKYILIGVSVAILIFLLFFFIQRGNKQQDIFSLAPGAARLYSSRSEGEAPHSTTFKITLAKGIAADPTKFSIDFGDGKIKSLMAGQSVTHFYEVPGRYYTVLFYNEKPCDTLPIYLKTKEWTATVTVPHDTTRVYPVDIIRLASSGKLEINAAEVQAAGVDTAHTFFVIFANMQPFPVSADNFELSANIVTSPARPGVRCSQADIFVFGEKSLHKVIFIKPGCVNWCSLQFSEIKHEGEQEDLSFMGTDLTRGGIIKLSVINKKVSLLVNDKKIYETSYQQPLGKIYGIQILFAGLGTINGFNLKDLSTGQHFSDGFTAVANTISTGMIVDNSMRTPVHPRKNK